MEDKMKDFLRWFVNHYGSITTTEALLAISMAGHFHIHTRQAKELMGNCRMLGCVSKHKECITIKI